MLIFKLNPQEAKIELFKDVPTKHSITAIFLRNNLCFIGCNQGAVGYIDISLEKPEIIFIHEPKTKYGKSIDSFAFDANSPKEILAVDDIITPKYAYWCSTESPKYLSTINLPRFPNDQYFLSLRKGEKIYLTSHSYTMSGPCTSFYFVNPERQSFTNH